MNYDKLSRSLRYYYEKGIMQKVKDTKKKPKKNEAYVQKHTKKKSFRAKKFGAPTITA